MSLDLVAALVGVAGLYALLVVVTHRVTATELPFKRVFATFAFVSLPLAFAYHMAHNLNHLLREGACVGAVFRNPLGLDTLPLSMAEKHARHLEMLVSQDVLFALQTGLMIFGFVIAVQVVRHCGLGLLAVRSGRSEWRLAPMLLFAAGITMFHLWLLMQPMVMRM